MNSYNGFTPTQRIRALRWINAEFAAGRRQRPTRCEACGQDKGIIEAHSEDYSEPFGDHIGRFGFCYRCHMMLHCRFKNPEAWAAYKAALVRGVIFAPLFSRNFPQVHADHLRPGGTPKMTVGPQRKDFLGTHIA